jgi:hypothetical protein
VVNRNIRAGYALTETVRTSTASSGLATVLARASGLLLEAACADAPRASSVRCSGRTPDKAAVATHSGQTTCSKPVSQPISGLRTGMPVSGRWWPHPIGQLRPFAQIVYKPPERRLLPVLLTFESERRDGRSRLVQRAPYYASPREPAALLPAHFPSRISGSM